MASILILGGTAFVSEALARFFIEEEYTVDILTRGIQPVKYLGVRNHLKGDRKSFEDMERLLCDKDYDYVVDVSAYVPEDLSPVIKHLKTEQLKKYVFCSSGGVYEDSTSVMSEDYPRLNDLKRGAYCLNKRLCEDLLFEAFENNGLPIAILRPSYIYGKGNNQYREAYYFKNIIEKKDIQMPYGKNNQVNFIHINDLVMLFKSVMESPKTVGKAYNATNDEVVTWHSYIEALNQATQDVAKIENVSYDRLNQGEKIYFPFIDMNYELSMEQARQYGLHIPQINLVEGLQMSFDWYCMNNQRMEL